MLGDRIKLARESAGLSLRELGEQAGVSAMAVSKYERGESTPSSKVLLGLAAALGVRTEYFFRTSTAELTDIRYRKRPGLGSREEARILADLRDQTERWLAFEELVPTPWSARFELPDGPPRAIETLEQVEQTALALRDAWQLGHHPIPDLIDLLEERGLKVFLTEAADDDRFDGLTARADGTPVIVLSSSWPGDRQRFTLAHELGHLVLGGRLAPQLDEEAACNRFAGSFLVPAEAVSRALGRRRHWLEPQELMLLKQEYGLSMQAWSRRAAELGIFPEARRRALMQHFRAHGWNRREPDPQLPREIPRLFRQLVYRALAEELIGESKAAELLGVTLKQLRACRNMECFGDHAAD